MYFRVPIVLFIDLITLNYCFSIGQGFKGRTLGSLYRWWQIWQASMFRSMCRMTCESHDWLPFPESSSSWWFREVIEGEEVRPFPEFQPEYREEIVPDPGDRSRGFCWKKINSFNKFQFVLEVVRARFFQAGGKLELCVDRLNEPMLSKNTIKPALSLSFSFIKTGIFKLELTYSFL